MWEKLKEIEAKFEELGEELSSPEVIKNRVKLEKLAREHKGLSELVATYRAYRKAADELRGSREIIESSPDPDLRSMAEDETKLLEQELSGLEQRLEVLLLPKDPNDEKNVIIEIRAAAGGDEAGIFAADLFRMYLRYSEERKWKMEILSANESGVGGYKEVIAMVNGDGAYSRLKYESGVHRVQRVPETESQGRVHTSTVSVVVLPEAEDVEVSVDEKDLRVDVYRSSGPGGQSVNTTDSAVRITHVPTGIVVAMQDEKSQLKNKDKAMKVLKARLLEREQQAQQSERQADRRSQVGTGERSEKVRTYNFPQSRVTDHRIGLTLYSLDQVINGDLDQLVDPLVTHFQMEALKSQAEDTEN